MEIMMKDRPSVNAGESVKEDKTAANRLMARLSKMRDK